MSTLKKKETNFLSDADLNDKNIKARITTYLDLDILKLLKAEAKKRKVGLILRGKMMQEDERKILSYSGIVRGTEVKDESALKRLVALYNTWSKTGCGKKKMVETQPH